MGDNEVRWITVGQRALTRVRVDQIATMRDDYMNGYQHYVYLTLTSGQQVKGEVNADQWKAIVEAVR